MNGGCQARPQQHSGLKLKSEVQQSEVEGMAFQEFCMGLLTQSEGFRVRGFGKRFVKYSNMHD